MMLIDYNNYEQRKAEIESKAPKAVENAIGNLMLVDYGNSHIHTKHTDALTNITQSSAFAYNKALLQDLTKSYDEIVKSLKILYNTGYSDLISQHPTLIGKEIDILIHKSDENDFDVNIFSKEEIEFMATKLPIVYTHKQDNKYFYDVRDSYYDSKKQFESNSKINILGYGRRDNYLLKEKKIMKSKSMVMGTDTPLILEDCASYSGNYGSLSLKGLNMVEVTSLLKQDYIDNFLQQKADISLINFIQLTKRVEQFTLGYYLNETSFKPSSKSRRSYTNNEYDANIKKGREVLEGFKNTYYTNITILQGAIDTDRGFDETVEILITPKESRSVLSKLFTESLAKIIGMLKDEEKTVERLVEVHNNAYNATMETLDKLVSEATDINDSIGYHDEADIKEQKQLFKYIEKIKMIDSNLDIYDKIMSSNSLETSAMSDNISKEEIEKTIREFVRNSRASIFDNKIDSYVLNFRENRKDDEPMFTENAILLIDNNPDFKSVVEKLEKCKFHDYYEIDAEFIKNGAVEYLDKFADALESIEIPAHSKTALRWRKLGNYRASGIYFSHAELIGEDFRHLHSYIHEITHHIDISSNMNKLGRNALVNSLTGYFDGRITEKRDYYLSDVELIARAGEVAYMLELSDFDTLLPKFKNNEINSEEFIETLYKNFEASEFSFLMEKLTTYSDNPVYIDVKEAITSGRTEILESLSEYFKSFYSNQESDIKQMLATSVKSGFTNRKLEGLVPNSSFKIEGKYEIDDMSKYPMRFELVDVNLDTKGTKEIISIDSIRDAETVTVDDVIRLRKELALSDSEIAMVIPYKLLEDKELRESLPEVGDHTILTEAMLPKWINMKTPLVEKKELLAKLKELLSTQRDYMPNHITALSIFAPDLETTDDVNYAKDIASALYENYDSALIKELEKNKTLSDVEIADTLINNNPDKEEYVASTLAYVLLEYDIDTLKEAGFPKANLASIHNTMGGLTGELSTAQMLSKFTQVSKEIYGEEIGIVEKCEILTSLDNHRLLNKEKITLPLSIIDGLGEIKDKRWIVRQMINVIAKTDILNKDNTATLSQQEKIEQILKQDITTSKENILQTFLSETINSNEFEEFSHILKSNFDLISSMENNVSGLPRFVGVTKEKTDKDSQPLKITFSHDLSKMSDEEFASEMENNITDISGKQFFLPDSLKLLSMNNKPKRVLEIAELMKGNSITRDSILPIVAREIEQGKLVFNDEQLSSFKSTIIGSKTLILSDKRDGDYLQDFSFGEKTIDKVYDKFIDYLKNNSDDDIVDSLRKVVKKTDIKDVSKEDVSYSYRRKSYIEQLISESAVRMLTASNIQAKTIEAMKSNRQFVHSDIQYEILNKRNFPNYLITPETPINRIQFNSKSEAKEFMQKFTAGKRLTDARGVANTREHNRVINIVEKNNISSLGEASMLSQINTDEIMGLTVDDTQYEVGKKVSFALVLLNSIKSFTKNDNTKDYSQIEGLCDTIGEKIVFENERMNTADYNEEKEFNDTVYTISKGIYFIEKLAKQIGEEIPLVSSGKKEAHILGDLLEVQTKLNESQAKKIDNAVTAEIGQ
jgi:hypothetical protein